MASTAEMGVPDKMTVFQKCVGSFNRTNVSAAEARDLLTQLVHLFYTGESFPESEATQLFFTITRLFQKTSLGLKQMVYLAIKELVPFTDNVIMGTSVLMRDVQQAQSAPATTSYRPEALRALCRILDAGAVEGMDRLMRSAIVDSNEPMRSAGLVSAYHLLAIAKESVRRWATEIQESVASSCSMAQYHALGLLIEVRSHDQMALLKLAVMLAEQGVLACPNAMVLHARLVGQLLREQPQNTALPLILKNYCFNRSDLVALEASKTILLLSFGANPSKPAFPELVEAAIGVLRAYLESPRAPSRFAAIRALSRYAELAPSTIAVCNDELEAMVTDHNPTIATYAITTLLRTGAEANMDTLIERVSDIVGDKQTSDDFKLVVVDAVRSLAKRFPSKHDLMLDFFANLLQFPGAVDLKLATVEAISDVLHTHSAAKSLNNAIAMLAETIEDSEYPELIVRVLYLLGQIGPQTEQPSTCVRVIYNRIILENAVVRAAAVSALAKFADVVPGAKELVRRARRDLNDEVRDRASVALLPKISGLPASKFAVSDLESQLVAYLHQGPSAQAFDAQKVRQVSDTERFQIRLAQEASSTVGEDLSRDLTPSAKLSQDQTLSGSGSALATSATDFAAELGEIKELADLGTLLHTGPAQALTDADMEYAVLGRVHVYQEHLVVQYVVQNNYDLELTESHIDFQLENELVEDGIQPKLSVSLPSLAPSHRGSTYLVFSHQQVPTYGFVSGTLTFQVDGELDSYPLDELEIRPSEFVRPVAMSAAEHAAQWAQIAVNEETEHRATHQFKQRESLPAVLEHLRLRLGLENASGFVPLESDKTASLLLSGAAVLSNEPVLAKIQLVKSARMGVAGKLVVRSQDQDMGRIVADGA